jgi:ABC-type glycerol-3-phosphate transport system substrate-binding protein
MKKSLLITLSLLLVLCLSILNVASAQEVTTIRFYGADQEYNQNIVKGFEAENPDVKVEIVPIDFNNAEQIIKTGIASGDPVDVSFFWGTNMITFTENDMALDLSPYLTANDNEWKNTFVPAFIDAGLKDGNYYAVSYQPVIETIFYNVDLFADNNIKVPETWDELLDACVKFKALGVYGIGCWNGFNHQMLQSAYQYMANDGTLAAATSGQVDFTTSEGLKQCLLNWKNVYDNGYWYPGEGALTSTKEQTEAAWYQGKIAMVYNANAAAGLYEKECPFTVGAMKHPLVKEGGLYALNFITNALFIPVNAKHPEEAIRFMKYYTSDAGMMEVLKSGRAPTTISMQAKIDNALIKAAIATSAGDNVVPYSHLQLLSSEINIKMGEIIGAVCMGTPVDEVLQQLEDLRKAIQD